MHNELFYQPRFGLAPVKFLNAESSPLGNNLSQQHSNHQVHNEQPGTAGAVYPVTDALLSDRCRTVLVVEDEFTVRLLITEVLNDMDYVSLEAADGPSGLQIIRSDVPIDLLIADIGLPGGMTGRDLAAAARAERPELAILYITGYAESAVLGDDGVEPGTMVLTKPFSIDTLTARIAELVPDLRRAFLLRR